MNDFTVHSIELSPKVYAEIRFFRGFVTLFNTGPSEPVRGCVAHYHDSRALDADFASDVYIYKMRVQVSFTGLSRVLTGD